MLDSLNSANETVRC